MNLIRYTIFRLISLVIQIIGAIALIMIITSIIDLDPSVFFAIGSDGTDTGDGQLGTETASAEEIAEFREDIGVDKTVFERFSEYITAMFSRADLGNSWFGEREPVVDLYLDAFITTLTVFGLGILLFTVIAIILGIMAARRLDGSLDKNVRLGTSFFYSFPPFVLGTLLIFVLQGYFVTGLQEKLTIFLDSNFGINATNQPFKSLFDGAISNFSNAATLQFLPVFSVMLIYTGFQFRLVRIYMSEVLNQNYIRTAHAKGLTERMILLKHGLRNALPELITSIATTFPVAFSGVAVLEKVFAIEGSGLLLINSGLIFNWPVLIGGAVIFTALNAIILTTTDLIVHYIDPQLRLR